MCWVRPMCVIYTLCALFCVTSRFENVVLISEKDGDVIVIIFGLCVNVVSDHVQPHIECCVLCSVRCINKDHSTENGVI